MTSANGRPLLILAALSLLYLLLLASTFNALGQMLPFMLAELHMSWAQAGLGFTLLGVACGLSSLAPAAAIRRLGTSATLWIGAVLLAGGFALLARMQGLLAYQAGTILLGIGFSFCGTVPGVQVISAAFERRATALGVYFTVGSLGAVAGPISVYLVHQSLGGWRAYWWLCAAASLLLGGFAALATREQRAAAEPMADEAAAEASWPVRDAIASPQFWVVVAAYTGCLLVNTTVHGLGFQQLMDHGLGLGAATAWVSAAATVGAVGSGLAGLLGERVDGRRLTMLSLGALALTGASLAVGGGLPALILFAITMGIGLGFSYVGTALLLQQYFGRGRSLELYSVMTLVSTAAAIGPVMGGVVHDRTGSFSSAFAALALVDLVLLGMVAVTRRPQRVVPLTT